MEILYAVLVISGLGLIFGIGLSYASRVFAVKVDERVALVREVLPGANCGACGYSGCDGYASAVAAGEADTNCCPVGGSEGEKKIADIMGVEPEGIKELLRESCATGGRA